MSAGSKFTRYTVGKLYNSQVTRWPDNWADWRLSEGGVELLLFVDRPTDEEINNVWFGRARFALVAGDNALILAYRFGPQPWCDAPWQACRQPDITAGIIDVPSGYHLPIMVFLIDSTSGILQAMRRTSWNAEFAGAVRRAVSRQLLNGSDDEAGLAEIAAWYRRYPTTKDLVDHADIVRPGGREIGGAA